MLENRIKRVVARGGVAVGTVLGEFGTRGIAMLLEYADIDWVMLGIRHGNFSTDSIADLVAWFQATEIAVIASVPIHLLSAVMDAGATGVQVQNVESAADARSIVHAVMYPPLGDRSVNLGSPHTGYARPNLAEYIKARNAQTSIVANIESEKGLANIDEIAAVEGIDTLQASHNDLSVSLGIPQQYEHPVYIKALQTIGEACRRHGKMFQFHPLYAEEVTRAYGFGCRIMGLNDAVTLFQNGLKREAVTLREQVGRLAKVV